MKPKMPVRRQVVHRSGLWTNLVVAEIVEGTISVIMRMILDILGQILRTLWAHKLRSVLTMFGIAWGVGSLLLLVGLGEGFRAGNRRQFDELGENVMFIWGGRAPAVEGSFTSMRQYYLTYNDYLDVLRDAPDV